MRVFFIITPIGFNATIMNVISAKIHEVLGINPMIAVTTANKLEYIPGIIKTPEGYNYDNLLSNDGYAFNQSIFDNYPNSAQIMPLLFTNDNSSYYTFGSIDMYHSMINWADDQMGLEIIPLLLWENEKSRCCRLISYLDWPVTSITSMFNFHEVDFPKVFGEHEVFSFKNNGNEQLDADIIAKLITRIHDIKCGNIGSDDYEEMATIDAKINKLYKEEK